MSRDIDRFISIIVASTLLPAFVLAPMHTQAQSALRRTLDELDVEPADPAVDQLMLRAGRSEVDLGESLSKLTRMGEFERVNELLQSIATRKLSEQQKIAVAAEMTADQRLRIVTHPSISAEAVQAIDEIFDLRQKTLADPNRLAAAIEKLTQRDVDVSLPAIRTLFEGGEASTAALVKAIVATNDASKRDTWLRAMIRIDEPSGTDALRRLALYGTPQARTGALGALIRLAPMGSAENHPFLIDILTAAYRGSGEMEAESKADPAASLAIATITRSSQPLPSRQRVIEELRTRLHEATRIARQSTREFGRTEAWLITPQRDAVQPRRIAGWVLAFRDAADIAARLIAVGDNDPDSVTVQLNATIAYTVAADPDWGGEKQLTDFRENSLLPAVAAIDGFSEVDFVLCALKIASESENEPAMLGWLRLVSLSENSPPSAWLASVGRQVSPLVEAVDHPHANVRYAAAAAIARLAPTHPYAGSNRVIDRWKQLSQLDARATAIILENRPEVVAELERLTSQAGFRPLTVSSVSQLEVCAAAGDDLRLILCKRSPLDASGTEMIDVIRRIRVARDVPLVIYSDPPPQRVDRKPESETTWKVTSEDAAFTPDKYGVIGGIDNIEGVVHRDLLYGDLDVDTSVQTQLDLSFIGASRWGDESLRAGLIREMQRPQSVAGLYGVLLESRQRQHLPPLTPIDRSNYRRIGTEALESR